MSTSICTFVSRFPFFSTRMPRWHVNRFPDFLALRLHARTLISALRDLVTSDSCSQRPGHMMMMYILLPCENTYVLFLLVEYGDTFISRRRTVTQSGCFSNVSLTIRHKLRDFWKVRSSMCRNANMCEMIMVEVMFKHSSWIKTFKNR